MINCPQRRWGVQRRLWPMGLLLALLAGIWPIYVMSARGAPATQPAAAVQLAADTQPAEPIRLDFKNAPLDTVLEQLSQAAGFVVIKDAPLDARVTVLSMRPVTPQEAVTILDTVLKGSGLTAIRDGRTLRIVSRDKAKKGDVPVHFGDDPAQVAPTDELITQVIPVKNVDAVKLATDLRPLIGPDADFTSNAGSNAIIMTDTSANVRRVVRIINTIDKREGAASEIRIIPLKNASASAAARLVLAIFRPEDRRRPQPGQPAPPPAPVPQGKIGSGVDQALEGEKVTAAADDRTNSVIVAGPSETIKLIENMLHDLDTNPATAVVIKSFHLKVADATSAARMISAIFENGVQPGQARGVGDQPLAAHVSAAAEERTNTVVVTAPASVMAIVEGIVKELEASPSADASIQSFHLKYADATATATALLSVFQEGKPGESRRHASVLPPISVTPDDRTNTLIISATPEAMRTAERLIRDLDANPADSANVRYFHLKQADATAAAKLITNLFEPPKNPSGQTKPPERHISVNAQADDRSNTVIVSAPPDSMKIVEELVKQIETNPSTSYDIKTYALATADAEATAKLISSIFAPDPTAPPTATSALRTKINVAADDRTNTVVVTAPQESLKIVDALVKLLDTNPGRGSDMQVFQLQYADAQSAAKLIQTIFPQPQLVNGQRPPPGANAQSTSEPQVTAAPDERTNTLVVTAPGDVLTVINVLVHQLDSNPASQETFFIYRLRNGQAENMSLVLNEMFGNIQGPTGGAVGTSGANNNPQLAQRSSFGGQGLGLGGQRSFGGGLGSNGSAGTTPRRFNQGQLAGYPGGAAGLAPAFGQVVNQLSGHVIVVADPDTNSLLVTTDTKYEKQVRQIIAELDHPVPQVLIKVLVAEVTHDSSADFGTDFSILNTRPSSLGQSYASTFGQPGSGLVVSFVESKLNATLHALAQQNKLDVLSRPYILASDNQEASVLVGQQVPIVTGNYTTGLGQIVSNYQYQSVGIILDVTPHINPDGLVTLDVAPEISQLTEQTVSVGPGVNAPVIADRRAFSRVAIRDGQTIVIGGLMQDQKTLTVNKIPILGDIPFIGVAFSRTQIAKTKTELLIFLTPHVAQQPESLEPMSQDEMKGTRLTPRAVAPGTFEQHMRGMQRGSAPRTQPAATQPLLPVMEIGPAGPDRPGENLTTRPVRLPAR